MRRSALWILSVGLVSVMASACGEEARSASSSSDSDASPDAAGDSSGGDARLDAAGGSAGATDASFDVGSSEDSIASDALGEIGEAEAGEEGGSVETCDPSPTPVTYADTRAYLYDNATAAAICLPMLTCGMLVSPPDSNQEFAFLMCMSAGAEESAGRSARAACVASSGSDCVQLEACITASNQGATETRCEAGQRRTVLQPTGEVVAAYACDRVFTGGICDPTGKRCVPCGPSVTSGCGTPRDRCESESVVLDCRIGPDPNVDITYAMPCGAGYHCVDEYQGPTSYSAACEADTACSGSGFACDGTVLTICDSSHNQLRYDCLGYGFSGCSGERCVF